MSIFKKNAETETNYVRYESVESVPRDTIIGRGTMIEGIISSKENVCIEGLFKGKIMSEACVIVGEGGKIEADITADTVLMSGEVHGNIIAKSKLEIPSDGKLRGNIKTGSLVIAEGVLFEGNCQMMWEEAATKESPAAAASRDIMDTVR
jgi:cytoskeletal protein CcmA (bactofilin family)